MLSRKEFQELNLNNNFLFVNVLSNKELCKQVLEKILNIKIERIEEPEYEKSVLTNFQRKSVRYDVYVREKTADGETISVFNIEIQNYSKKDLGPRSRYYQSSIDTNELKQGIPYSGLPNCYIIFICTFDPFGEGRHIYHFENRCLEDHEISLQDRTQKVILNTRGRLDDVDDEMRDFLRYIEHSTDETARSSSGNLVQNIHKSVQMLKESQEKEAEFMTLEEWMNDEKEEAMRIALEQGRSEGLEQGRSQGEMKGKTENTLEMARKMKLKGTDPEFIAEISGLTLEQIEAL